MRNATGSCRDVALMSRRCLGAVVRMDFSVFAALVCFRRLVMRWWFLDFGEVRRFARIALRARLMDFAIAVSPHSFNFVI